MESSALLVIVRIAFHFVNENIQQMRHGDKRILGESLLLQRFMVIVKVFIQMVKMSIQISKLKGGNWRSSVIFVRE